MISDDWSSQTIQSALTDYQISSRFDVTSDVMYYLLAYFNVMYAFSTWFFCFLFGALWVDAGRWIFWCRRIRRPGVDHANVDGIDLDSLSRAIVVRPASGGRMLARPCHCGVGRWNIFFDHQLSMWQRGSNDETTGCRRPLDGNINVLHLKLMTVWRLPWRVQLLILRRHGS